MEEKKIKIEVSRLALIFIILFGLSLLVWSFVIGVWIGTKMGAEAKREEIAREEVPISQSITSPPPLQNETISNETTPPVKITPPVEEKVSEKAPTEKIPEEKKNVVYQKKEVAKIASEMKSISPKTFYSLQVGAFSEKEKAENLKNIAIAKGYQAFIKEIKVNDKTLYKVYVGKYPSRAEAEKNVSLISNALKIEKPFVVEIK